MSLTLIIHHSHLRGSRDGAVVRALISRIYGPGLIPGVDAIRGLSLSFSLVLAPSVFLRVLLPPCTKTNIPIPGNSG